MLMKKLKILISTMLCLSVMCTMALPAHAMAYSFDGPGDPNYGDPTSFEPVVTPGGGAQPNEDQSKDEALIPPGFGTPTSYLPGSGDPYIPENPGPGTVDGSDPAAPPTIGPGTGTGSTSTVGFTQVTSDLYYANGSLGTLKIPSIGLTGGIYEGTGSAPLLKGAGHFEGTSIWDGNVPVAGHNRGVRNDFGKIHTLRAGAMVTLTTRLGTRTYAVTGVNKVSVNDVSGLAPASVNMVTLYTCVENQPAYRWCVTAVQI